MLHKHKNADEELSSEEIISIVTAVYDYYYEKTTFDGMLIFWDAGEERVFQIGEDERTLSSVMNFLIDKSYQKGMSMGMTQKVQEIKSVLNL